MTNTLKVTMTKDESVQLKTDLSQFRKDLVGFKGSVHELAYRALVHFHNHGDTVYIQEFYDIIGEDKLLRKAAFAKWVLEYAPAVFSDKTLKFTKNTNPNRTKELYMDNAEVGSSLLASAYAKRFWDMSGGEESVNPTTFDVIAENMEKLLARIKRDEKKGVIDNTVSDEITEIVNALRLVSDIVSPLTTKELQKQAQESVNSVITESQAA